MQILPEGKLRLETAFEARMASKALSYEQPARAGRLILAHYVKDEQGVSRRAEQTNDEAKFFNRELDKNHKPIVLTAKQANRFKSVLEQLVERDDEHLGITPEVAEAALRVHQSAADRYEALRNQVRDFECVELEVTRPVLAQDLRAPEKLAS